LEVVNKRKTEQKLREEMLLLEEEQEHADLFKKKTDMDRKMREIQMQIEEKKNVKKQKTL